MNDELTAVDREGCDCLRCERGESVPLDQADEVQLRMLALGKLVNATGHDITTIRVVVIGSREVRFT